MDKIAEMLTKIRNAQMAGHESVEIKFSKFKLALAQILKKEGFVEAVTENKDSKTIKIGLKYVQVTSTEKAPAIRGMKKISKSGQRIYIKSKDIKNVKNDFGVAIFSTSKGVMTGEDSKKLGLGGEYVCEIW